MSDTAPHEPSTVYDYIDRDRLVRTFLHLTSIDSVSFREYDMANYLQSRLFALGLDPYEDGAAEAIYPESGLTPEEYKESAVGNLVAKLPGNGVLAEAEPILFSAHMDTVAPGLGKKAVLHEDGTITSDGTTVLGADDAAGLAEILELITVLTEHPELPHPPLEFVFPVAEEVYGVGSKELDYFKLEARTAYVLDKSGPVGSAAVAAPAIVSIDITVNGLASHAGFAPEAGVHAIKIAGDALSRITMGRKGKDTTVNIGVVSGGVAKNIVPNQVVLQGEVRSMSNERAEEETQLLKNIFEVAAEMYGGSIDFSSKVKISAYRTGPLEDVTRRFERAAKALELPFRLEDTFGGSDNNHFSHHGIRGIVLACGMNRVHSTDEWTTVEELERAAALILQIATDTSEL